MILLGIDPGTATTGFGIIDISNPNSLKHIHHGQIKTSKDLLMPERLYRVYNSVVDLVLTYKPNAFVIERIFFNTNVKTAMSVGQARGVYMMVAGQYKIPVFEYTALEAKMALTGYGRSEKSAVRDIVAKMLDIKTQIKPVDASDALAIAICHNIKTNPISK